VSRFGKWFAVRVTVDLWASPFGGEDGETFFFSLFSDTRWEFQSHSLPPVILHASKEARTVGLKHCFLEFEIDEVKEQDGGVYVDLHYASRIYVNWDSNIIYRIDSEREMKNINMIL
jgi:hypothetical protein